VALHEEGRNSCETHACLQSDTTTAVADDFADKSDRLSNKLPKETLVDTGGGREISLQVSNVHTDLNCSARAHLPSCSLRGNVQTEAILIEVNGQYTFKFT